MWNLKCLCASLCGVCFESRNYFIVVVVLIKISESASLELGKHFLFSFTFSKNLFVFLNLAKAPRLHTCYDTQSHYKYILNVFKSKHFDLQMHTKSLWLNINTLRDLAVSAPFAVRSHAMPETGQQGATPDSHPSDELRF